jgi:hypothetical protein
MIPYTGLRMNLNNSLLKKSLFRETGDKKNAGLTGPAL